MGHDCAPVEQAGAQITLSYRRLEGLAGNAATVRRRQTKASIKFEAMSGARQNGAGNEATIGVRDGVMGTYDPETLKVLRRALDQAWALLPDERKAVTFKADMADRILKRAAEGERDPVKLRVAALIVPSMMMPEELL